MELSLDTLPFTLVDVRSQLEILTGYGCDIFVVQNEMKIPLWRRSTGFDAAGLDLLMRRGTHWYVKRKQERTVKPGDRIAVLGRGIAVVEQVEAKQIHAVLCNRSVLRIRRRGIVWNDSNMRWETQERMPTPAAAPRRKVCGRSG